MFFYRGLTSLQSDRFEGKIVVRAAQAATQFQVSAEARAAARLPDIEAHVTYRVAGMAQLRPKIVSFVARIKAKMMSFFSMFR